MVFKKSQPFGWLFLFGFCWFLGGFLVFVGLFLGGFLVSFLCFFGRRKKWGEKTKKALKVGVQVDYQGFFIYFTFSKGTLNL